VRRPGILLLLKGVLIKNNKDKRSSMAPRSVRIKQRSQWPVIGWVTKIYYLQILRASEGTLSRWSRLHLRCPPTPVSKSDIRQAAGRKNNCRIFITT
jgi:hypothetical protein